MKTKRIILHILSMAVLIVPNLIFLICNYKIIKEVNAISLTMVALITLSIIGIGALTHVKIEGGIWAILIGLFVLSMGNISIVAGIALIIEGVGIAIDGYILKPLIEKIKVKEFEGNGGTITYTREFK